MRLAVLWERRGERGQEHLLIRFAVLWERRSPEEHLLMRFAVLWERRGRPDPGDLGDSLMRFAVL